jgi:hypothetical protein
MAEAFDPLPLARLGRPGEPVGADGTLPSDPEVYNQILEALATYSRVMLIVPSNRPDLARELQLLAAADSLWRAIFWMPDASTLANVDWPTVWAQATEPFASVQLVLPPFTPGGWLFRFDPDGRACTFRIIAHTYKDKLAKTIEELCAEMKSR